MFLIVLRASGAPVARVNSVDPSMAYAAIEGLATETGLSPMDFRAVGLDCPSPEDLMVATPVAA